MQNISPEKHRPLRIRAYLQSRVCGGDYQPLDGILYNVAVRERFGEQKMSMPGQSTVPEGAGTLLPFERMNANTSMWFYACSFAQWSQPSVEWSDTYNKRFDLAESWLIDFANKTRRVNNISGEYKNWHIKGYYRHSLYIDWYCNGQRNEIERLLPFVTNIGKKASQGEGSVLRWEVTDWPEDWSVRGYENKLMRAVPAKNGVLYGLRPSYWLPKHQFLCKLP